MDVSTSLEEQSLFIWDDGPCGVPFLTVDPIWSVIRVDKKRKRVDTVIVGPDGKGGGDELEWMHSDVLTRVRRYREEEYVE